MNGNGQMHPGRSVEFLSRLHDGELTPAERARFETHRAHCAECRRAAIEFEDALALFRSARTSPPRADLAARILRKVQTTHRPRSPFSPRFRMDLGWAALVLTGIFALLLSTPSLFGPRPTTSAPAASATPAPELESASGDSAPAAPRREIAAPQRKVVLRDAPAKPAPEEKMQAPAVAADEAVAPPSEDAALEKRERDEVGQSRRDTRRVAAAPQAPQESASAGGEGEPPLRAAAVPPPLRLSVTEVDGFGAAPALVRGDRIDLPPTERGNSYVLVVDSQGAVRQVTAARERFAADPEKQASNAEASVPRPLYELRFQPGNRPRRLLVRID